ncbi:N-acetylglucosamine-6-phosphate deacetylase [Paenibacillus cremeus]|uniref:N-acetylglucosamine-6-phosphate deacetylase n=1 Tax=Paenibacillus cremeus TaxID=2163881 RepID=A0A559KGS8_9BACL|nr:N-acetylglucosamine-6-phosphate deacetylase [Paenibacillus cremeus]TVY11321.1 N-acetylglucosamine-6-phosphate deacetylase [Paenibacillus cremeus]
MSTLYVNGRLYTPNGIVENGRILVSSNGQIEAIGGPELEAAPGAVIEDVAGASVLPGFIDVHVHGGNGFNMMEGTLNDLNEMSTFHAAHGTTSFLATTSTNAKEKTIRALQCAAEAHTTGLSGADLLGVHLEGPFINDKRRGAQKREHIRLPSPSELAEYIAASGNTIRLVTLAPEVEGGFKAVEWLVNRGISVSIGHSDATFEQVERAVKLGVNHTTHHFNGMSPLHHREPGVAGAGLILNEITTELIADGIHVHPAVIKLLFETKTPENVCMITDAVTCAGLPDGEYGHVTMTNGQIYLKDGSSLAGSSLTTIQALKNVMQFTGYPMEHILPSLTLVPARQIGVQDRKGSLEKGKDADFLLVDDELEIQATYVKGHAVYRK